MKNPFAAFGKRARASRANERAREHEQRGRTSEAIAEYLRACSLDPQWSVPFYNLGLLYKYAGDWEQSLLHNQRASELAPGDQAGFWNLGIAATALGRWDVARAAWRGAGLKPGDGSGPIDLPCGHAPVRLNPQGDGEVVWTDRVDPARAIIRSIPLPESGFRFGDELLNDGAANGYRRLDGRDVPVFDCLALLRASRFSTWVAELEVERLEPIAVSQALDRLSALASDRNLSAEDWSTSVQVLCKACSEGRPGDQHEHAPAERSGPRRVAIAATAAEQARELLDTWIDETPDVALASFELALRAG